MDHDTALSDDKKSAHRNVQAKAADRPLIANPIFIMGPGRSGTTLLRSLLSAHSRISIAPETQFMARAEEWGLKNGAPEDFEAFWSNYTSWVRFDDLGIDSVRCRELIDQQGAPTFQNVFRAVLAAYREQVGKDRVGEKTPGHTRFLSYLLDWFPDGRVLIMQRDPRAVVASQLQTPWVQERLTPLSLRHGVVSGKRLHEVAFFADNWTSIYTTRVAPWKNDPRLHTVSYERLVRNTEEEMRTICDFVGESFEPSMLTDRTRTTVPMPAGEAPNSRLEKWRRKHHAKTLSRITTDSLDKWKKELTKTEVAMIEGHCIQEMRAAKYTTTVSGAQRSAGKLLSYTLLAAENTETAIRPLAKRPFHKIQSIVW